MARLLKTIFEILLLSTILGGCALLVPPHTVRYIVYPVKSGDTVYAIAKRFGVSPQRILEANNIKNPRGLAVGQTLKVPIPDDETISSSKSKASDIKNVAPDQNSVKTIKLTAAKKYVGRLYWPVKNGSLSSRFGRRWFSFHEGIDVSAEEGEPIYAAHDAVVAYSGSGISGYGNLVILKGDYIMTVYGHNSRNRVDVGERVSRGEKIAEVGSTGKSTGPHLHFETRIKDSSGGNVAVDPLAFFPQK